MSKVKIREDSFTGAEIAVIGMDIRLPGAKDIDEFWDNLKKGVESITFFSEEELIEAGIEPETVKNPHYIKAWGVLEDIEYFDAVFFGFIPGEVRVMDPQMRIFHECAWKALEDAGYDPDTYDGLIGLYTGAASEFTWQAYCNLYGVGDDVDPFAASHLMRKDHIATRISYKLNLKGPSLTMATACSSSLVAVNLACQGILSGECDMALAGGVNVSLPQKRGYMYGEGMIFSTDGHNKTFDASASGTVFGNGIGLVVLKLLDQSILAGDHIYAVIKGFATNNDGIRKSGYAAPSLDGQAEVIRAALEMAEVPPETIGYVEAHGTATELGDPVEIEALKLAFNTERWQFCAVGSVKTNVGHLDNAAGIAGLIKTVLAVKHRLIPPSLFFKTPNPQINFKNSPFYVNTTLTPWEQDGYPLRAGVSSFGIGGTNAHVVLEEAPDSTDRHGAGSKELWARDYHLIVLSARTEAALERVTLNLADHLKRSPGIDLADVAYTLQVGRKAFEYRKMAVCADPGEAVAALTASDPAKVYTFVPGEREKPVVFMFPGQGSQYVNMGRELYEKEPLFREELDRCFEILEPIMGYDIKEILYPGNIGMQAGEGVNQTEVAQPVLFAFEYALSKLLLKWGIKPYAMIGHSIGEYVAACLAGVLSLEAALTLVALRGRLMQQLPPGSMLGVPLPEDQLQSLIDPELAIAAVNTSSHCVVSGLPEVINAFENRLKEKGYEYRRLHTSHAFHSGMMGPIVKEFEAGVRQIRLNKPKIAYISNLTGTWISHKEVMDEKYWGEHLRRTVRFDDGLRELLAKDSTIFVEVGPGQTLHTFAAQHQDKKPGHHIVNLVRHPQETVSDLHYLLGKIGWLWLYGRAIDWSGFYEGEKRKRVSLPTYPFERGRYWVGGSFNGFNLELLSKDLSLRKRPNPADWFYVPSWRRSILVETNGREAGEDKVCLVFMDEGGLGLRLVEQIKQAGQEVICVGIGTAYEAKEGLYLIRPAFEADYKKLFDDLKARKLLAAEIIHLWSVTTNDEDEETGIESVERLQERGFFSLLFIARSIEACHFKAEITITAVVNSIFKVTGEEDLNPGKSTLLGPLKVIPQEYPDIRCRCIDVVLPQPGTQGEQRLIGQLVREVLSRPADKIVALRGEFHWVQVFESLQLGESVELRGRLTERGVYIITGGLGNIGLVLARYLAERFQARLVLTGRSPFPAREEWPGWLSQHGENDNISRKIGKLLEIERLGAEVVVMTANAAVHEEMVEVVRQTRQRFGQINGVIHGAGDMGQYPISRISRRDVQRQFQSKIYGLGVLEEVLTDQSPDFCLLLSSSSAVLGGLGLAAYAAANIFMDTFAWKHEGRSPFPWISYNLDVWDYSEEGKWADRGRGSGGATLGKLAMTLEEGLSVFCRVLNCRETPQVIQSTADLQLRIGQWIDMEFQGPSDAPDQDKIQASSSHYRPRPNLLSAYILPQNQLEQRIAEMWQSFFGIERVGVYDDFFELGGDSLKALSMLAKMHKEIASDVSLVDFFERRTIKKLAEFIAAQDRKSGLPAIKAVEKRDYYPVSSSQKRLYVLHQMNPEALVYNLAAALLLEGRLDTARLQGSFRKVVKRHEIFRTAFEMVEDRPVQRIHNEVEFEVEYHGQGSGGDVARQVNAAVQEFARPFILSRPPLLRVKVIKSGVDTHIMIVDMHHIIHDGISQINFFKEFTSLYAGEELQELHLQYKDYVLWQDGSPESGTTQSQGEYWLNEFKGDLPVLNLPLDYPRPSEKSSAGEVVHFKMASEEVKALKAFTLKEESTLFMVLLAIYYVFLSKLSGQEDIVVGTPIAGRRHPDLEPLIGFFLNTLVLRNFPLADKPFRVFLKDVKACTLSAFDHQDYPFEDLVEQLEIHRDMSRNPLFDVMFIFQSHLQFLSEETFQQPAKDFKVKVFSFDKKTSEFDLNLIGEEEGDHLNFKLEYCTKLFRRESILRFITYFKEVLLAVLKNPAQRLSDIEMIPDEEKDRVLSAFNNTEVPYPTDKTIYHLFGDQAERIPDHNVLIGPAGGVGAITLTYRELEQRSCRLARLLGAGGVKPSTIVGICLERCPEMVIGILGILKSGGAYLPIDPGSPQSRIDYMLNDSGATLLVTDNECPFPSSARGFSFLAIGRELLGDDNQGGSSVMESVAAPSDLAYTIYTSGSTGRPKGVMVSQRSVVNVLYALQDENPFGQWDTYLLKTSYTFDVSVTELFGWFMGGGRLAVMRRDGEKDPGEILDVIEREHVTHINFVPSMFNVFLEICSPQNLLRLSRLKFIFSVGEALLPEIADKFRRLNTQVEMVNLYGPTEGTVYASKYSLSDRDGRGSVPIGKPLPNVKIYILDKGDRLQPPGVFGELVISGVGLARGYLNRPELTAEKFVGYPLRHYKTGDLTRWLPDGNIEFLGRMDGQVKIRGHLVELGEIEAQLLTHEDIREAVVTARKDEMGDRYLCAHIVSDKEFTIRDLRRYLGRLLPDYMIPAYLMQLEMIPHTESGKVNRRALPDPEVKVGATYAPPRNEIEERLAQVWQKVLKVEKVGIYDNFLEIGGNSIKIMQLSSGIAKEFSMEVNFRDFLKYPTVAELSALLSGNKISSRTIDYPKVSLDPENIHQPFPLTDVQMAYLMGRNEQFEMGRVSTHIYQEAATDLDIERLNKSLNKVINRHPMMRMIVLAEGQQQILPGKFHYEILVEDLIHLDKEGQERRIAEERKRMSHYIFKPDQWPLFEIKGFRISEEITYLCIGIDLLFADAFSIELIYRELMKLYLEPELELPELAFTFRDYMITLGELKDSHIYREDKTYWLDKLEGFPSAPALPLKCSPSEITVPHFKRKRKVLTASDWGKLKEIGRKRSITPSALLCTAYARVLEYWSNQSKLAINLTVFNRFPFHPEVDEIVGDFTSLILLGLELDPRHTFMEFAQEVQDTLLEGLMHRHYDGVAFIREIGKHRQMVNKAVMPVVFTSVLSGQTDEEQEIDTAIQPGQDEEQPVQEGRGVSQTSQVFLDNVVADGNGQLAISWNYVADLFEGPVIAMMFEHYIFLLKRIIQGDEDPLLPFPEDHQRLIEAFNRTEEDIPPLTLSALFNVPVRRIPDHVAVEYGESKVTYGKFNEGARRVAYYLGQRGIVGNDLVGVRTPRGIDTVIRVMGIVKAGAAYVPLEPQYPQERIDYIMKHSKCKLLLEADVGEMSLETEESARPGDLAYVIFTSGSTGKPKGVMITHRQVTNTIVDINQKFSVNDRDRIMGISSMCFDLSVYDVFGTLSAGAVLAIINDQRDVEHLIETVESRHVTLWNSVPAIMEMTVNHLAASLAGSAGETLYWSPSVSWGREGDSIRIGERSYQGVALRVFPELYFLAQEGISLKNLLGRFPDENFHQLKDFIWELVKVRVLVDSLLPPEELFLSQPRLFKNRYGKEIFFIPEAYDRFKKEQLSRCCDNGKAQKIVLETAAGELPAFIRRRRSYRTFNQSRQIPFRQFSTLLSVFKQRREKGETRYYYASAGGLYPIDVYLYIKENRVENMAQGLYYYNPSSNALTQITGRPFVTKEAHYSRNRSIFESSAFSIFMVYNADVTMPVYKGMGYFYAAIDSGLMVDALTQVSEELGIGLCSIGDMNFERIKSHFNLDNARIFIHAVELGLTPKVKVESAYGERPAETETVELSGTDSGEEKSIREDGEILYWCPGKNWLARRGTIEIDRQAYSGAALSVIPRLYALGQHGISGGQLEAEFSRENRREVEGLVDLLVKNGVLVRTLLTPRQIYHTQSKLFHNRYGKEILYIPEAYDKFKRKQLSRTGCAEKGKPVTLEADGGLPPALCRRRSYRHFDEEREISFHEFSILLSIFRQTRGKGVIRYYYASAGGLYPIDIYIYIKGGRVENTEQGLYYYHPPTHTLNLVRAGAVITGDAHYARNQAIFQSSALSIFLVYNAEANMPMYGGMGYFYAAIDSGIMVGTLTRLSEKLGIGLCSIGDMDFQSIKDHFNLDKNQVFIHAVELGFKPNQPIASEESVPETGEEERDISIEKEYVAVRNRSLRLALLSGDWLPLSLPPKIREHFINAKVVSLGGATEGSIWSIYYPIREVEEGWKSIPYGFPLANQKFYVLNQRLELCPVGVPGELYIGGAGVAEGYIGDEEKTRHAFIHHPQWGRIYKTGDFGRLQPAGYIEFLGRKDQQVKIRGYRVELGEIENCLLEHSAVKHAVVIDRNDDTNRRYLCAYVVTDREPTVAELREFLSRKLPEYMVPAHFTYLETIPLTANGKIDRKSLPEPAVDTITTGRAYAPPETEIEKTITGICLKMFNLKRIGMNDNFFELGLNSIDVVKISSALRETFGMVVPVLKLFEYSTIRSLAGYLSREQKGRGPVQKPAKTNRTEAVSEAKNRMRKRIQARG